METGELVDLVDICIIAYITPSKAMTAASTNARPFGCRSERRTRE
jgi:hypothetical protein